MARFFCGSAVARIATVGSPWRLRTIFSARSADGYEARMANATRFVVAVLLCFLAATARASDRPYLSATNAVADEDDENVAALESWFEISRHISEFRFEPEYNFNPRNAVRVELGIARDRRFDPVDRSRGAEVEYKHLFTDIARSDFGSGIIIGVDWGGHSIALDAGEDRGDHIWSLETAGLLSLRPTPDTLVHFNLGGIRETGGRTRGRWAIAVEHEVVRRTTLFVEAAATASEERLLHGGVRY